MKKVLKKDAKAKNLIVQCIADSHLGIIREKETAHEMWRALENTYEKKGLCGTLMKKRKLLGMKMIENEPIQQYIQRFDAVITELRSSVDPDTEIKDDELVCNFLMGVSKKYDTVVSIIESMDSSEVTFEFIKRRLRNEDEKNSTVVKSENSVKPVSFNASRNIVCHFCGKNGHMKRDCWHFNNQGNNFNKNRNFHKNQHLNKNDNKNHQNSNSQWHSKGKASNVQFKW